MPGLRYGFDITDDAATTLDALDRATTRMRDATLSAEERAQAKQMMQDARDRIRTTFGNMRTARMFAAQKGEFGEAGTATGPNGREVNARNALSKSAHQAYMRLQKQGRVPELVKTPQEDGREAYKYGATRADRGGATAASRRLVARTEQVRQQGAQRAGQSSTYKATREAAARPGATAGGLNATEQRAARASQAGAQRKRQTRARRSQG